MVYMYYSIDKGICFSFSHMCMVMRGVERSATSTITSCMLGVLLDDAARRHEFLTLIQ